MEYDEFFTDGDKPYSENLNDSLMLLDAFDVTVPCEMPTMFNNGDFSSSVNVTRKCGVALVTLKSVDSGVTVGTSSISGTGSVVFRVYPNFNSFYKWSKILLEKSGTVAIGFKKADGTDITVTVSGDGTIGDAAALKMLEEIDVVLTLDDASISNILIWFVNDQTEGRVRTSALLEASQLVNVNGTIAENDLMAVNGDTVNSALEWKNISIDEGTLEVNEILRLAHFKTPGITIDIIAGNTELITTFPSIYSIGVNKKIPLPMYEDVFVGFAVSGGVGRVFVHSDNYTGHVNIEIDELWRY